MTTRDEIDILIPAAPAPDSSNKRLPLGVIQTPDRVAGAFRGPAVNVPGEGVPATADGGDRRAEQRGTILASGNPLDRRQV